MPESWIIHKISEAREIAVSRIKPEPLFNSPKCVRCSLAPICLPDETRIMKQCGAASATTALNITNDDDYDTDRLDSTYNRLARFERNRFNALKVNPPRRLIAAGDQTRALYLNTQGARVTVRSEVLVVKEEKTQVGEYRLKDLSHVALFGNIQITTQAIQTLSEAEIPIAYFSMGGWFYALTRTGCWLMKTGRGNALPVTFIMNRM